MLQIDFIKSINGYIRQSIAKLRLWHRQNLVLERVWGVGGEWDTGHCFLKFL